MTPISTLVRVELYKLLHRPMTRVLAAVFVVLALMVYATVITLIFMAESSLADQLQNVDAESLRQSILLPEGVFFGGTLIHVVGSALLIILAAGSIGSEFTWATLRTALYMGASRARLLLAKFLALGIMALLTVVLGFALTLVLSLASKLIVGPSEAGGAAITAGFFGDAMRTLGVTFVIITVWAFIAAGISLVTRSLATGMGITLVLSFLGGQIAVLIAQLGTAGRWVSRLFPNTATGEIGALLSADPVSIAAVDWLWITANIAGWAALAVVLSLLTFRRTDLLASS